MHVGPSFEMQLNHWRLGNDEKMKELDGSRDDSSPSTAFLPTKMVLQINGGAE